MKNRYLVCSWWPILLSFLLLAVVFGVLMGGMGNYLKYRKAMQPTLELDESTLHFFTRDFLLRRYQSLFVEPAPDPSLIPAFHLYADEHSLDALDSDLPASGKVRFVPGHVHLQDPEMSSEVDFRYRGGLPLHWLYEKKSLRIKLPPYTTYRGERQFNVVNPSTIHTITDWISYDMARDLGLLTPDYFPVRLYINNKTNGVHFFLSRIDESFLRKNRRMPGSIYSGDTVYVPNPFGADEDGSSELTFKNEEGKPLLWTEPELWDKEAARNAESKNDRTDIELYLSILNDPDNLNFYTRFNQFFDKQKTYNFLGLDTITGSFHHDNFHNHKIYFDPYKGRFEPIAWDLRFWSSVFKSKDLPIYPLLRQIKMNPVLEYERDLVAYQLMKRFDVDSIYQEITKRNEILRPEMAADPHRQHLDPRYGRFTLNKEVPFSLGDYDQAIENLKIIITNRFKYLESVYSQSEVVVNKQVHDDGLELDVSVSGNSPVNIQLQGPWKSSVSIEKVLDGKTLKVTKDSPLLLYPGRMVVNGNAIGRADHWSILAFGDKRLEPSPLHYKIRLLGYGLSPDDLSNNLRVNNAITGVEVNWLESPQPLPSSAQTISPHPWGFKEPTYHERIILSGAISVNQDLVYEHMDEVVIEPGTRFLVGQNKSIIFRTRVLANGTEQQPIVFERMNPDEPWGAIIIHGARADHSHLDHIQVKGGSLTRQNLINYPGQINIHEVADFKLRNCWIGDNVIGDDSLHVAYSTGHVDQCQFKNTAFDAVDMDITQVTISNSKFNQIGNDAVDLMTSEVVLQGIDVNQAGDKCISVGESSKVTVLESSLANCFIGMAVKDESIATIDNVRFEGNRDIAIGLYQKNSRYGKGGTLAGRNAIGINQSDILLEGRSESRLEWPTKAASPGELSGHGASGAVQ